MHAVQQATGAISVFAIPAGKVRPTNSDRNKSSSPPRSDNLASSFSGKRLSPPNIVELLECPRPIRVFSRCGHEPRQSLSLFGDLDFFAIGHQSKNRIETASEFAQCDGLHNQLMLPQHLDKSILPILGACPKTRGQLCRSKPFRFRLSREFGGVD